MIMQLFLLLLLVNGLITLYLIRRVAYRTKGWLCLSCNYISLGFFGYVLAKVFHILRYETLNINFSYLGVIIETFSILIILMGFLKLNRGFDLLDHQEKVTRLRKEHKAPALIKKTTKNRRKKK